MTAATAIPAGAPAAARRGLVIVRLLRLELRHNAMAWLLPVAIGLFWLSTYRKAMAMPPLWNLRAASLQSGAVLDFIVPVTAAAAWTGSREARRRLTGQVTTTARPRWARLLAPWAATTIWAMVAYLGCVAVLYGVTAHETIWGGPLWWPAAVAAASLPAFSALGFVMGTYLPSRFTAPLAAIAAFFVLALSTELIQGSQSYWNISPIVTGPWDLGPHTGVATFYPFVPDLSIAQVMFLAGVTVALLGTLALPAGSGALRATAAGLTGAGLLAAGTAAGLAGTGTLDAHGMIDIPALHDAATDQPIRFTPVCSDIATSDIATSDIATSDIATSGTAIPVCFNPAYASYLPATAKALAPLLSQLAGLPGAPARIVQETVIYRQGEGNSIAVLARGPLAEGTPRVFHLVLPDQLLGQVMTAAQLASQVVTTYGPAIVGHVIGDGPGASEAQNAVAAALMMAARPKTPANAAAERFGALPAAARHAWLVRHLAALRAGRITLAELP